MNEIVDRYRRSITVPEKKRLTEEDVLLITYGDQLQEEGIPPLTTLTRFCEHRLGGILNTIHLLPFYPFSSDDGFSVKDYLAVDPQLGSWQDIDRLSHSFCIMFDAVINHTSVESAWFKGFLDDDQKFRDYFITVYGNPDLSKVFRPRSLPLVHEYTSRSGPRQVWTTFSADQADLNYANPEVLLAIVEVLLEYVKRGASLIRLDAIAFLWKEIGTRCIHLPQTHAFIQLLHTVFAEIAPHVLLVTETNVPHEENLSYFGNGSNEAALIYNFALPPLMLHTFYNGDASAISDWAESLRTPSDQTNFLNFLASHDGIGINPVRGILLQSSIDTLISGTLARGGLVSYSADPSGQKKPYELNISYFDALADPSGNEPIELQGKRFLTAHAMMLSLSGLPAIYFHSLFGSRNWPEGVTQSGINRRINREKLQLGPFLRELDDPSSLRAQVFKGLSGLLLQRRSSQAFDPASRQEILHLGKGIFAVRRTTMNGRDRMLCLHNVTGETLSVKTWRLPPYETLWVRTT